MRVLFATAELSPIATVGGLAAAAAGLSLELRRQGVDVELIVPDYGDVELSNESVIELDVPAWAGPARIRVGDHPIAGRLHLVDVPGMARSHPYLKPDGDGWPDNAERFFRFARAIAARVEQAPPDVLHLNDWHTGAVLAALTDQPPTVVSIHNLAYQGVAPGTVAQADRSPRTSITNGGVAPTRSPVPSRWPTRSSRCRRTTRGRSSRRSSGAA